MRERGRGAGVRRVALGRFALAILVALLGTVVVGQAAAADESPVPEDVAAYFATGLIPRLADLYGSAGSTDPASTFDDTTKVGTIHRLLAWTPAFLAGQKTESPTQLTNTWIAPVTAKEGTILGLAAVWINPGNDVVELADFSRGRALVDALGRAPKGTQLIDDTVQQAWFASDGKTLTPLVTGKSGTSGPLTPAEYQKTLLANAAPTKAPDAVTNPGLLIAGITLGGVVLLLAIFVLLPGRKNKEGKAPDAAATPRRNPRNDSDRAFDRKVSSVEARATSVARAAISAEAGMVDAMAGSEPAAPAAAPLRPARTAAPRKTAATGAPSAKKAPAAQATRKSGASTTAPPTNAAPKAATARKTTPQVTPKKAPPKKSAAKKAPAEATAKKAPPKPSE